MEFDEQDLDFEKAQKAFKEFMERAATAMQPAFEAIKEFSINLYNVMRKTYEEAGSPYGETDQDMYEYFKDLKEIEDLKRKMLDQIEWKETLMELRSKMKEKSK